VIRGWVQKCDVLLALVGPKWAESTDPKTGLRRLDNPDDFVRIEIVAALNRGIPVVPVLLDDAPMPNRDQVPQDLRPLLGRNAEFVSYRTFDTDVERLIKKLSPGQFAEQIKQVEVAPSEMRTDVQGPKSDIEGRPAESGSRRRNNTAPLFI